MRGHVRASVGLVFALIVATLPSASHASDHADVPISHADIRPDLNWTDLYVFTHGDDLVLVGGLDPTVPSGTRDYVFPTDAEFRFLIDTTGDIFEEISLNVSFETIADDNGVRSVPTVQARGYAGEKRLKNPSSLRVFTGARDDPFIRGPRGGRNVAAIVLEMPLAQVLPPGSTTLHVWGTTETPRRYGEQVELAGRALRDDPALNTQHPSEHPHEPNVVTFDISGPATFPNGRALSDDVVDRVPELGLRGSDLRNTEGCGNVHLGTYVNCVTTNDRSFAKEFPYLAPPH